MKDLNLIQIFLAVVEHESFTDAALVLGLPKATVSYKIAKLEKDIGMTLLSRSTRVVKPTAEGFAYAMRCRPLVEGINEAGYRLEESTKEPRGILRVKAPTTYTQWAIAPHLPQFLKKNPGLQVHMSVIDDQRTDIIQQGIDLVVHVGEMRDSALTSIYIGHSVRQLFASKAYLQKHPRITGVEDLKRHLCLVCLPHGKSTNFRWGLTLERDRKVEVEVSGPLVTTDYPTLVEAAKQDLGIALLPVRICKMHLRNGALVRVLPAWRSEKPEFHALVPSGKLITPKVRAFIDFLKEHPW